MTPTRRPRGRALALAGSLLLAFGLVTAFAPTALAQPRAFDPEIAFPTGLLSGPDGALWMLGGAGSTAIARIAPDGDAERIALGFLAREPFADRLVPLADGGVGVTLATGAPTGRQLVTVRRGEPPRVRTLPACTSTTASASSRAR